VKIIKPVTITDAILAAGSGGSNVTETDALIPEFVLATAYVTGNQVSETASGVHRIYEASQNTQNNALPVLPAISTANWFEVGATNRWKAFDKIIGSKTTQATSISYHLVLPVIDSIALLGLEATEVSLIVKSSVGTTLHTEVINLINNSAVFDWYSYFFEEIVMGEDVVRFDLPVVLGGTLDIVITNTGGTARVGEIVIGNFQTLGKMQFPPQIGITDYSTKDTDTYGNVTIVERAFSLKLICDIEVENVDIDDIANFFVLYRVTPLVWIETELPGSFMVYGFYKAFEPVIEGVDFSIFALEVEGLT